MPFSSLAELLILTLVNSDPSLLLVPYDYTNIQCFFQKSNNSLFLFYILCLRDLKESYSNVHLLDLKPNK